MSKIPISPLESFHNNDSPPDATSLAQLNIQTPSLHSDSSNNATPIFPETDEIKSGQFSIENLKISEALKFHKLPSKGMLPSKSNIPYLKNTSLRMDSHHKISSNKESMKESTDSKVTNNQRSLQKSGLSLRLWESSENFVDENVFIRKLKKMPKTKEDAKFIFNFITQFPFFHKFHEENLQNSVDEAFFHICRYCDYEKCQKNSIIFKEGDRSNEKFYIIISGTVFIYLQDKSVYMQENLDKTQGEIQSHQKSPLLRRKSSLFGSPKLISRDLKYKKKGSVMTPTLAHTFQKHSFEQEVSRIRLFDEKVMPEIGTKRNELGPGEAFGEKALLINDPELAKRTATIVAATDVEFMIIKKMQFDRIIQRFSKQNEKKVDFLKQVLPFLNSIHSISTLENLVYSFKEESIGMNMTLWRKFIMSMKEFVELKRPSIS